MDYIHCVRTNTIISDILVVIVLVQQVVYMNSEQSSSYDTIAFNVVSNLILYIRCCRIGFGSVSSHD